jgi:retinol dehydrogenase 12
VCHVWDVDLGSFASVQAFAARAESALVRLDAFVANASVMAAHFDAAAAARDGFEQQMAVNVLGTFLLALLVLPKLRATSARFNDPPRLVVVSSDAHVLACLRTRNAPGGVLDALRGGAHMADRYGDSKLLQILVARELALELDRSGGPHVIVNTLSPGLCRSQLFRHAPWPVSWFMPISLYLLGRTLEMGSRTLVAAASAGEETHGKYMVDCKVHAESSFVRSEEGRAVQKKVFEELLGILENVHPGIRANI